MFWNFHFNSSGIDTLLAKEDVTLTQILDEDDILQECKTQNNKLLDFLIEDGNLKQLLKFVVDDPPEDEEETLKYKYKNLACEVLIIDAYSMLDKIANNEEFLDILWSLIERPPPLNPLIASFFSKVFFLLVCRKPDELLEYMKKHDAVNKLIVHIEISAIMSLFVKMVINVEPQDKKVELTKWLDEENFIEKMIDLLKSSEKEEKHDNISQLLSELIKIGRDSISQYTEIEDPLLLTLEKKETMECLVKTMLEDRDGPHSDSSIMAGVATFLSMMEVTRPVIEGMEEIITQSDLERIADGVRATAEVLAENMQGFHNVLSHPITQRTMETTFGKLDPPLGKVRLAIVSLVATCCQLNSKIMNDAVAKTKLLSCMLESFRNYEWHNFLHGHVQNCIIGILNTSIGDENGEETNSPESADNLLKHLFKDCDVIGWCVSLWNSNIAAEASCSNGRKGYMGHLTVIMNEIINSKEKGPNREIIMSIFNDLPQETRDGWNNIVSTSLAETNEKNMISPLNSQGYADSESSGEMCDFEGNPLGKRTNVSLYDGTLQQAFENYQVQPMTNEFLESFGYDEANIDETENLKNPFDEVGNIDISINANEESENERLFESICEQKIKPFDDSDEEDEDDIWEEKQLTFTTEPRQSEGAIKSESSDEDEEDENKSEKLSPHNNKEEDRMDVDNDSNDSSSKGGFWQADFSQMDVQSTDSNRSSDWASSTTSSEAPVSSSAEDFADFTDISKFGISEDNEHSDVPVAMETDGSTKLPTSSPYEVKMEEDASSAKTNDGIDKSGSQITQITAKSVVAPETTNIEPQTKKEEETTLPGDKSQDEKDQKCTEQSEAKKDDAIDTTQEASQETSTPRSTEIPAKENLVVETESASVVGKDESKPTDDVSKASQDKASSNPTT